MKEIRELVSLIKEEKVPIGIIDEFAEHSREYFYSNTHNYNLTQLHEMSNYYALTKVKEKYLGGENNGSKKD